MSNREDVLASVSAMLDREANNYQSADYLSRNVESKDGIDKVCRRLMAEWCLKVVDRCSFSRDTASIAMNMLDRFLSSPQGEAAIKRRHVFQLASMTCLYTAIIVHESEALQPQTIVQLSRGMFTVKEVEEMELEILFAIQWKTSPPTAWTFVKHFLEVAPQQDSCKETHEKVMKLAKLQTELTVVDYDYVTKSASSIAYAALANAYDMLKISNTDYLEVLGILLEIDSGEANRIRANLMKQMRNQQTLQAVVTTKTSRPQDVSKPRTFAEGHSSPREVASVNQ